MASHSPAQDRAQNIVERSPVYYGWIAWAVAALGLMATSPGQSFSVALFIDHYIADFNLDRTTVSSLFSLGTFISSLTLTYVGTRIDLHGNRRVGTVVLAAFAVVLVLLSLITGPITLFFSFLAIRFLGQGALGLASTTSIAQWWELRRGWMTGLSLVLFAVFQSLYVTGLERLIDAVGWRGAWIVMGLAMALLVLPVWWLLMRDRPEDFGLLPDNANFPAQTEMPVEAKLEESWTLREAQRTPLFWIFLSARIFVGAFVTGLVFHQVSLFAEVGHSEAVAAQTYGILAIINAVATLGVGRIISKLRPGFVIASQMVLVLTALYISQVMTEQWLLYVYAACIGVTMAIGGNFEGTVWADLFGRKYLGSIRGFSATALVLGTSLGPIIFALSYDNLGGYGPIIAGGILIGLIPLFSSILMNQPRRRLESQV
jgi:MFS family permease